VLNLEGTNHAYVQFFPQTGAAGRKGWLGYGGVGSPTMTIRNDAGALELAASEVQINCDVKMSGKHAFRANDSWLRLNQDRVFTSGVHTPTNFAPMALNVGGQNGWGNPGDGNAWIAGKLTVWGDLQVNGNNHLYSAGRMHINGEEICYILNKKGVTIGKEWGGDGTLRVQGSKNFQIHHPLDQKRWLVHSAIEGPEAAVFYRGVAELDNGACTITLPHYFEALARAGDRTVLVTPKLTEGGETCALAAGDIVDGKFTVRAIDGRNPKQRFYWEAKGVRADIDPIEIEPMKEDDAVGLPPMPGAAAASRKGPSSPPHTP
jgi:hypothetical protein